MSLSAWSLRCWWIVKASRIASQSSIGLLTASTLKLGDPHFLQGIEIRCPAASSSAPEAGACRHPSLLPLLEALPEHL